MISDENFNGARDYLFLDTAYPLLHETSSDNAKKILLSGIKINKSYNCQVDRVLSIPKDENDFKNYNYHPGITDSAIVVVSFPIELFGDININSSIGHLFMNGFAEKVENEDSKNISPNMKIYGVRYQKHESIIPSVWVNGYFDNTGAFVCNSKYILRMDNYKDLLAKYKQTLFKTFSEQYPDMAYALTHNSNTNHVRDDNEYGGPVL